MLLGLGTGPYSYQGSTKLEFQHVLQSFGQRALTFFIITLLSNLQINPRKISGLQWHLNQLAQWRYISCGHTTDFHLGKSNLPREVHQKSPKINSSRVLFYPGEKFYEGHTTAQGAALKVFTPVEFFWNVNLRRQDAQGSSWSKRRFFLLSHCYFLR